MISARAPSPPFAGLALLLLVGMAGCGSKDGDTSTGGACEPRNLTIADTHDLYAPGPDLEHGCADDNPTRSVDVICVSGDRATGFCCGDVGYALHCSCGEWVCPTDTVLISECKDYCDPWGGRPDGGT